MIEPNKCENIFWEAIMSKLNVLWTNADPITSEKMVMMYTVNSIKHKWWDEITLIIWGAPSKLVAENEMIQEMVEYAIRLGIKVTACKACADQLGVSDKLVSMGIEVKYWGEGLTEILKNDEKLITI